MDTISRENNSSMLPVAALIIGIVALLLGGYAAIKVAAVNRTVASQQDQLARIDTVASQASTAAAASDKAARDINALTQSTQNAFNQVGAELGKLNQAIDQIKTAPRASKSSGGAAAVAGPDEYIVKHGDTGAKIARAHGVSLSALQSVNPDVNWNRLGVGQKIKLPKK